MNSRKLFHIFLAASLVLVFIAPSFFITKVNAGTFTDASLTISDSRATATGVEYDFAMTATSSAAIKQVDITFCTTSIGACTPPSNMNTGTPHIVTDNLAGSGRTVSKIAAADNTIRVVVTTPADQSTQDITISFNGITNTETVNSSFYARIQTYSDAGVTPLDSAVVASAVLSITSIYVTADVSPFLSFTVTANNVGTVNGAAIDVTSADDTIPFGTLLNGTSKIASHEVAVTTNATNGYKVTVNSVTDPPLQDGANNIDKFNQTNGSPAAWSSPTSDVKNINTGFFGYTTEDFTLSVTGDGAARFQANKWAGFETTPAEIVFNPAAPGGSAETTKIGWQAEVNNYQPPGAYSGSIILVATPTY